MQELQATHEALQQSRLACEERDYLIATHERSEAALAGHAGALTDELQHASDSMTSLFSRRVGRPSSQPSYTLDGGNGKCSACLTLQIAAPARDLSGLHPAMRRAQKASHQHLLAVKRRHLSQAVPMLHVDTTVL